MMYIQNDMNILIHTLTTKQTKNVKSPNVKLKMNPQGRQILDLRDVRGRHGKIHNSLSIGKSIEQCTYTDTIEKGRD